MGAWILWPLAGMPLVYWASTRIPSVDCGIFLNEDANIFEGLEEGVLLVALTSLASLCTCAAAIRRSLVLWRGGRRRSLVIFGGALLVAAAALAVGGAAFGASLMDVVGLGAVATGIPLAALAILWFMNRDTGHADVLILLYLLGLGLAVYPFILLMAYYLQSGAAC